MQHAVVLGTHVWPIEGSGFSLVSLWLTSERCSAPLMSFGRLLCTTMAGIFKILSENYAAFFYPILLKHDSI